MGFIQNVIGRVKKMLGINEIQRIINIKPVVSSDMVNAIQLWSQMYEDRPPWKKNPRPGEPEKVTTLGLPSLIASEKARMATLEMESEITPPMQDIEKANPNYEPPGMDPVTGMPTMGKGSMTITESEPIGPTERADFLNEQYKKLKKDIRRQLEYGIAKGGLIIKPYVIEYEDAQPSSNDIQSANSKNSSPEKPGASQDDKKSDDSKDVSKTQKTVTDSTKDYSPDADTALSSDKPLPKYEIEFDFIQADKFYPLAFDNNGRITEAAFTQQKTDKEKIYTRLEYHRLEGRSVTVENYAFVSSNNEYIRKGMPNETSFGKPCSLTEVPEWAMLAPSVTIDNVSRPLYAYFKMPEANTIDPYSPLGVSGYARAVNLIKEADQQYSRLLWEYEGGELAIDVDRDALKIEELQNGAHHTRMPVKQERLFRKVDLNSEETYEVFAPALRDDNYIHGLNTLLMRIEDALGLSRGTISENVSADARTATELKILKQRSYSTNADIQAALEESLRDAVYVMDVYCSLYEITPPGEYEISFEWDDSIIVDSETELEKRLSLINAGISSKLETRMWYFGETENQAKLALQQIDDEKKSSMETNITAQQQLGDMAQGQDMSGDNNNPGSMKHNASSSDAKKMTKFKKED